MRLASLRRPGGDLGRLPIGFDLRGLDISEGVRAALACAVVIIANEWIGWPPLVYMALAANLTCFCDVGGPIRSRVPALLVFTAVGATVWAIFGMLRPLGIALVVPLACAVVFCNAYARVYGLAAAAVGNVLTVVLVFALDVPLAPHQAAVVAAMFVAGGLWCTLLTLVIWRLYPARHARLAVAEVWQMLGELALDVHALSGREGVGLAEWEAHARAHRRAVRDAIERARVRVVELARGGGQVGPRAAQASVRLETADQLFAALIALAELLEHTPAPALRDGADAMLRPLESVLLAISRDILHDRPRHEAGAREAGLDEAIGRIVASGRGEPALRGIGEAIGDRLRIMLAVSGPQGVRRHGGTLGREPAMPLRARILGPIRDNLSWRSVMLRHAVRTATITAPALVVTLSYETTFTHWLPYTVVLVMQPFFAATWQRALERVGGTVAGALLGGLLAMVAHTPLALAALMFPLCVVGFAARQVSYGAYIACLTPQIVVLVELVEPGHSSLEVAAMRALFTLVGGLIAVAGSLLLWPSWEPDRLPDEVVRTVLAHAFYARAALGAAATAGEARRAAGLASNNLEAAIGRALQEPGRRRRDRVEAAMVVDAALRRLAGRLIALQYRAEAGDHDGWGEWVGEALDAVAARRPVPRRPDGGSESLLRIARQVELVDGALRRS